MSDQQASTPVGEGPSGVQATIAANVSNPTSSFASIL